MLLAAVLCVFLPLVTAMAVRKEGRPGLLASIDGSVSSDTVRSTRYGALGTRYVLRTTANYNVGQQPFAGYPPSTAGFRSRHLLLLCITQYGPRREARKSQLAEPGRGRGRWRAPASGSTQPDADGLPPGGWGAGAPAKNINDPFITPPFSFQTSRCHLPFAICHCRWPRPWPSHVRPR